jgi:PKD repeat protein
MEYHEYLKTVDASYESNQNQLEQLIQQRMSADKTWKTTGVVTVPVVFHILYSTNNATQNISNARITAQMDVLNQDFSGTNVDVTNVPSVFQPFVANTGIQFCLAVRDPLGNTTDGIIRKQTTTTSFGTNNAIKFDAQGGSNAWPRDSYLNIWVGNLSGGLLGYAQFPGGAANTDGVVILNGAVGGPGALGTASPYNRGRTATHEIGHWFNLRHIWGDATCGNDMVADTPTQQGANFGCPSFPKITCSNGPNGDMFMNYMDYVDDNCMIMFSIGQGTRMNTSITASRAALLNSMGCVPVSGGAPVANFIASATNITVGTSINFTDQSSGSPTTWAWTFTGGTPNSSNVQNPTNITYNTVGTFQVSLTVTNASGNDTETKAGYINVTAGPGPGGCDTLSNFPTTATPTLLLSGGPGGAGYVTGHNNYLDIGKADNFSQTIPPNYQAVGMLIGFGVAKNSNTTNTFNMKLWNATGPGGSPGTALATVTKTYADAAADVTALSMTYAAFPAPVNVTSPFYAGIDFTYAAGDTLAIIQTADGEVTPGTSWEQFDTGTWYAMSDATSSWGIDIGMMIFPILCDPTSTNNPVQHGIVIYPNPTNGQLIIHNTNNSSEPAVVTVTNIMGQSVLVNEYLNFSGTHYLNLSELSNGLYFVEVSTGANKMVNRIVLNK